MKVLHLLTVGEIGGIEVLVKNYAGLSKHDNIFLFLWHGGQIADEMISENRDVRIWDIPKDGMLKTLKRISHLCREEQVDVVISHHGTPFLRLALLWLKIWNPSLCRIAYKHSAAEYDVSVQCSLRKKISTLLEKCIDKWAFSTANGVIAISGYVKKTIVEELRVSEDKITVLYNGVPLSKFQNVNRPSSDRIRLIYVGRLSPEKGVQNIISAFREVADEFPVTLDIVGDGSCRKELEKQVETAELKDSVDFSGACMNVHEHLAKADFFIHMPACEEGFGITVVEAMAAGCLCICGAKGGIPEIIRHGVDGFLVSSNEELVQTLRNQMKEYLAGNCQNILDNAASRVEMFSIQTYSRNMDAFLCAVTDKESIGRG